MGLAGPGLPVGHDVAVEPIEKALDPLWHVAVVKHLLKGKMKFSVTGPIGYIDNPATVTIRLQ